MKVPVKESDIPLLMDVYSNQNGVDYFKFAEDVDPGHGQQRRAYKPLGTTKDSIEEIYGHTPAGDVFVTTEEADDLIYHSKRGLLPKLGEKQNADELMLEIQKWAYVHTVQFSDFLKDFDPLNSGECTCGQFRSALLMCGYRLTDPEYELLVERYHSDRRDGFMKWRAFSDDVMTFVAPKTLEHEPLRQPPRRSELMSQTVKERGAPKQAPPHIHRLLYIVNRYIVARRLSLPEQFVDKDKYNHKQVAATAFAQVLQLIGMHINKDEIDQLCAYYRDPLTNFVRYPDFVADVIALGGVNFGENDGTELVVNPRDAYSIDISRWVASCPKITADQLKWSTILPRIQSFIYKRRIRVVDFFENFDRLRHGVVTVQKFRSVVGQLDFPLTEDDIQFTTKLFACEDKPDLVNYRLMCEQINEIFGVGDLHRTPSKDATCRASHLPDPSLRLTDLDPGVKEKIRTIVDRMAKFVSTRRMEVRQQFEDYDRAPKKNYITKAQFKQGIARLGLSSNEDELELLCLRYKCTELDEQNYHAFCNDIDPAL
jgi:Ca2+-binding EF-hand superfamily protein